MNLKTSGAEAIIELRDGYVVKQRILKRYRVGEVDERLRRERTKSEAKLISEARRCGVPTPIIHDVTDYDIVMEHIEGPQLKHVLDVELSEKVGELVGRLHTSGIVHGDLTTSNMIISTCRIYLIDFGLAYFDRSIEAQGVDVHVLFQTFEGTHKGHDDLIKAFSRGYRRAFSGADAVLQRVKEIESRGRYRTERL
ncbi:MAG: Kae1-associated kinase Bud32 [Methanosarcinales archaeon Met12]|nr:MAG: Kae1-associated kinase Bud32 [Methanosarcinales archaeon Met12]